MAKIKDIKKIAQNTTIAALPTLGSSTQVRSNVKHFPVSGPPLITTKEIREFQGNLLSVLDPTPGNTCALRICGESMEDGAIRDGDLAIVDMTLTPRPGDLIIVTRADGTHGIKKFSPGLRLVGSKDFDSPEALFGVVTFTLAPWHLRNGSEVSR